MDGDGCRRTRGRTRPSRLDVGRNLTIRTIVYYLAANPLHVGVYQAEATALDGVGVEVRFVLNARNLRSIPLAMGVVHRDRGRAKERITRRTYGPVLFHPLWKPVYQLQLMPILLKPYLRGTCVVLHARTLHVADAALRLQRSLPRLRIVSELEGDAESELDYISRWGRIDPGLDLRRVVRANRAAERRVLEGSDLVVTVSRGLKDLLVERHQLASSVIQRIVAIPTVSSRRRFRFDAGLRDVSRTAMGLTDRYIVVYLGNLAAAWQQPEAMVALFSRIKQLRRDAFFLVVSPALEHGHIAGHLAAAGFNEADARLVAVDYPDVPKMLCAADVGLLLRRDHVMNAVASPAKLSEYLLSGLPVITSDVMGEHLEGLRARCEILMISPSWPNVRLDKELASFCLIDFEPSERCRLSSWAADHLSIETWASSLQEAYSRWVVPDGVAP